MNAHADAFVFFGATGDLAYKQIFPALQALVRRGHLDVPIVGVARSGWGIERLVERARASLSEHGGLDEPAFQKLVSDPAIRAVLEGWHISPLWSRQDCECLCAISHPDDRGVCDHHAVITRRISDQEVPLCAPCAVAQGVAEQSR